MELDAASRRRLAHERERHERRKPSDCGDDARQGLRKHLSLIHILRMFGSSLARMFSTRSSDSPYSIPTSHDAYEVSFVMLMTLLMSLLRMTLMFFDPSSTLVVRTPISTTVPRQSPTMMMSPTRCLLYTSRCV